MKEYKAKSYGVCRFHKNVTSQDTKLTREMEGEMEKERGVLLEWVLNSKETEGINIEKINILLTLTVVRRKTL